MNRSEHLATCKKLAHGYLKNNDLVGAVTSMLSDMDKHDGTKNYASTLGSLGYMYASCDDLEKVVRWIDQFN